MLTGKKGTRYNTRARSCPTSSAVGVDVGFKPQIKSVLQTQRFIERALGALSEPLTCRRCCSTSHYEVVSLPSTSTDALKEAEKGLRLLAWTNWSHLSRLGAGCGL